MTIRTDFLQVGVSNTATQNFTLKTNNDGTAKLARGNFDATTQDVINVNASGVVDFPQGATIGGSAGQKMLLTASQATTSGTFVDFTGIPSWAKKVTVIADGMASNGTSAFMVQIGNGSFLTTGYESVSSFNTGTSPARITTGLQLMFAPSANTGYDIIGDLFFTGASWVLRSFAQATGTTNQSNAAIGSITQGAIDRLRVTTVLGTPVFNGGSVSLLIEGY